MKKLGNPKHQSKSTQQEVFHQIDSDGDIYRQIFKFATISILVHDMDMKIIDANDMALSQFGYDHEELLSMDIFSLHAEDELSHSNEILNEMQSKESLSVETKFRRKDGSEFFAEATPCKYVINGRPVIHVFIQDITERKKSRQKLESLNEALNKQIKELQAHSREIEIKNKDLRDFAFVAAHDLKAPLSTSHALMNMIKPESFKTDQSRMVFEKLKKSIELLHRTVTTLNEVIDFKNRLKAKKQPLRFEEIFEEVKEGISDQLKGDEIEIDSDFTQCPEVNYPIIHLKSLMQNLLTNAVKYRKPDKPLKIAVRSRKAKNKIYLEIEDNGLGFDSKKYGEKMLGLFKRLHTHVEGKGVGMYLVHSILEQHGGSINIISEPSKGAKFELVLGKEKI